MTLTIRQKQLLAFFQTNLEDAHWFRWDRNMGKTFYASGGKGDPRQVLDGLAAKGLMKSECRKIDCSTPTVKSYRTEWWHRITEAGLCQPVGSTKDRVRKTGPVTSTDPRKKLIVQEMKRLSGGTKVTNVKETRDCFVGNPMKHVRSDKGWMHWESLPEIKIPKSGFKFY